MYYRSYEHEDRQEQLDIEKSGGIFERCQGPEGAAASYLEGRKKERKIKGWEDEEEDVDC